MRRPRPRPISSRIFGSCVVLPEPVSPHTTTTGCASIAARISARRALTGRVGSKRMARLMNSPNPTRSIGAMNEPEKTETAQRALVYVGVALSVVIILVLLWYAIDVVFLAFIGVLVAILLRAPADWLSRKSGLREGWSLALVGVLAAGLLIGAGALFGRGIAVQSVQLTARIPEIVETFKERLQQS